MILLLSSLIISIKCKQACFYARVYREFIPLTPDIYINIKKGLRSGTSRFTWGVDGDRSTPGDLEIEYILVGIKYLIMHNTLNRAPGGCKCCVGGKKRGGVGVTHPHTAPGE